MKQNEVLKQVLRSDELPTLPTVASKLITLTSREDTTLTDIADLVSKDVALSSKILKVSNSAFYSVPQQIGTIKQAVSILGINAVRSLVLSFTFLSIKAGKQKSHFNFTKFWERSLASAVSAKLILEQVPGADTEEIFISGLLQNLGELVLARTFPVEYDQVVSQVDNNQDVPLIAEQEIFETDHCVIGFEVAKSWGFPDILLLPLLHHHDPGSYTGKDKKISQTVQAVYLSDLLTNILFSNTPDEYHQRFRKQAGKILGLKPRGIDSILNELHNQVDQAAEYFGLNIHNTKSIQGILQEANIRLSLMNLDYDQMNKHLIKAKIELENLTVELEAKNKLLDNLANLDGLTGVFNHRYFQNCLEQEISRAMRGESEFSLIFLDIDHFKKFNDTYGHQVGDFILKEFCSLLQSNLRRHDTLARYGGEEFAVILPDTTEENAATVAEKLRKLIDDRTFEDQRDSYCVTASFGVTSARPATDGGFTKNGFISRVDQALYAAKNNGRNRVERYQVKKKWFDF